MNRSWGGPQGRSGRFGDETNLFCLSTFFLLWHFEGKKDSENTENVIQIFVKFQTGGGVKVKITHATYLLSERARRLYHALLVFVYRK